MDNIGRHSSRHSTNKPDVSVDNEVAKLFKHSINGGRISTVYLAKLREKYQDVDIVDKIQQAYSEKYIKLEKRGKKFAMLVKAKYGDKKYPFHILLEKAKIYKKKYHLSEEEFTVFQRIYENELTGNTKYEGPEINNNMVKILGVGSYEYYGFNNKLSDSDYKCLQDILSLHKMTKSLHAQVCLQSMQYDDCSISAINGVYNKELGHKPGDSVHAVIAALFLPKINILERRFIYASFSNIVRARFDNEKLITYSDRELFNALVTDPNDVVCNITSPMVDILKRSLIQEHIWNSVLHLRNGQYYSQTFRDFVASIDSCKINRYDNPDLLYGRYDGTVLRRLLAVFSFRPTSIATMPIYNVVVTNPYSQIIAPVVTQVPMINIRLNLSFRNETEPFNLLNSFDKQQSILDNGAIIERHTNFIRSEGVLFFFVDRRANFLKYFDNEFEMLGKPLAINTSDRISTQPVDFSYQFEHGGDNYLLRSVITAEILTDQKPLKNIVVGSSALIIDKSRPDPEQKGCFAYEPITVIKAARNKNTGIIEQKQPIRQIFRDPDETVPGDSFYEIARSTGIIFMYEVVKDVNETSIIF